MATLSTASIARKAALALPSTSLARKAALALATLAVASTMMASTADAKSKVRFHLSIGGGGVSIGHGYGYGYGYRPYRVRGCYRFKLRYFRTGNRYWLRVYKNCRWGYYY